ncbi:hypothetical protein BDV93DRAFT_506731 [Ceratobasidium sp. AG-I]|nr:hypothetical protein BDV93DRAFT_506731 [Ceratobasidium sp. AG-I]
MTRWGMWEGDIGISLGGEKDASKVGVDGLVVARGKGNDRASCRKCYSTCSRVRDESGPVGEPECPYPWGGDCDFLSQQDPCSTRGATMSPRQNSRLIAFRVTLVGLMAKESRRVIGMSAELSVGLNGSDYLLGTIVAGSKENNGTNIIMCSKTQQRQSRQWGGIMDGITSETIKQALLSSEMPLTNQ